MEPEAFDHFVREHRNMVYSVALTYCKDAHAAEDISQEAFLRAHRSVDGLADKSRLKTWLYTLTRNAAIDHLRAQKRRGKLAERVAETRREPPARTHNEQVDRLLGILETLPEDYRRIVLLRYVEGLSYKEIAEALGMQVSAVGEKLSRIRNQISERMAP